MSLCFLPRRHSELRSESDRKVASLEGRLEATIRKYETQLHNLQMENERLKSGATATEQRDNGEEAFVKFPVISFHVYPGCQRFFFSWWSWIVSGEAAIAMISIEASPLTIAASPRKQKKLSGTQGFVPLMIANFTTWTNHWCLHLPPQAHHSLCCPRQARSSLNMSPEGPWM